MWVLLFRFNSFYKFVLDLICTLRYSTLFSSKQICLLKAILKNVKYLLQVLKYEWKTIERKTVYLLQHRLSTFVFLLFTAKSYRMQQHENTF